MRILIKIFAIQPLFHQQGQQDLEDADQKTKGCADDLHEAEFFCKEFVQQGFESVGGEAGDLFDDDAFEVQVMAEVGDITLHDHGEELLEFRHKYGLQLCDGLVADEHGDHGHRFFEFYAEEVVDMFFCQGKDALNGFGVGDGGFDLAEGKQFVAHDAAKAFGDLLLAFWKHAMEGEAKDLFGMAGMEEEFEGHPDGEPVDKGRDKGDGVKPPGQMGHNVIYKRKGRLRRPIPWLNFCKTGGLAWGG